MSDNALSPEMNMAASGRFAFIDALRGLAALAVACHHIDRYSPARESIVPLLPTWLLVLLEEGRMGVPVFFVISGFVIAHTLRRVRVTPAFVGNFALRRAVRLDLPYWTAIALVLLLDAMAPRLNLFPSPLDDRPTWEQILAHPCYLQNVLGFDNLSVGFWSLCIEVQFYLLFVICVGIGQRLGASRDTSSAAAESRGLVLVFTPLALLSLFVWSLDQYEQFVLHFFCILFLGALTYWVITGKLSRLYLWGYLAAVGLRLAWAFSLHLTVALVVGLCLYELGRRRLLGRALDAPCLQYLGRISYSLYLVHYPISHVIQNVGYALTPDSPLANLSYEVVSLVASVGAAHLFYLAVENPAVRLAGRIRKTSEQPATPGLGYQPAS